MTAPKGVALRPATPDEAPEVLRFWHSMRLAMGMPDDDLMPDWAERMVDFYRVQMSAGRLTYFVAEAAAGGLVAGVMALLKDDYPYHVKRVRYYGYIGGVYTDPEYRGRGIANNLIRMARDWLWELGVTEIRLVPSREALPTYLRLGFEPVDDVVLRHQPVPT